MTPSSPARRYGFAVAICVAAAALAWLSGESSCLLAAITAACIYGGRGPGLLSIVICGMALGLLLVFPESHFLDEHNAYARFGVFLAAALAVGLLLQNHRRSEQAHRAAHETRLIVESMPGFGWSTDHEGRFTYLNPAVFDYTGTCCETDGRERQVRFGTEVLHPDEVDRVVKDWSRCLRTGAPYQSEHRIRRHDGVYRWFRAVAKPSRDSGGRVTGWYGMTLDIDDHKRTEEALRASERNLRSIVESIPGMIATANARGEHDYSNRRLLDYLGMDQAGAMRSGWPGVLHPEERDAVVNEWLRCKNAGEPLDITYRYRRFDGVYRWIHSRVEPAFDERGRISRWYGLLVDIDAQKKAEDSLRRSEQQLRLLIDTIPALVWCATPAGDPFYLNKRMLDYVGLPPEEATQSRFKIIHPDDTPTLIRNWRQSTRSGHTFLITYRLRAADGTYRWHEGRAEPFRDQAGNVIQWYGVNVDIDDRMKAEQALRSAQASFQRASQLASLAELSASIAHEVNQPLAAVITNSHACQRWLAAEPPNIERARTTTDRIIRDANAAAEVVSRIRALFKQSTQTRAATDINEVIADVCRLMIDELSAKSISMETDLESDLPSTFIDRVQMQQVLLNLIRNGIDAMEAVAGAPKSLTIRSRRDGAGSVVVEVRDRGRGIEDTERIFEPFFTTKEHGMGMGLAICRSIVEAHNGRLWAATGEPDGTAVTFSLPLHAGRPA